MSDYARELTELVAGLAAELDRQTPQQQWRQLAELGLAGVAIPEEQGGSDGELSDLVVVVAELARHGVATPIVEGATAAYAMGHVDSDAFASIVVHREGSTQNAGDGAHVFRVPYAHEANCLVVIAGDAVLSVSLRDSGDTLECRRNLAGQPISEIRASLGSAAEKTGVYADAVINRLAVTRSAALLGASRGAYELTKRYVLQREQFGAPLIKIPAVAASLAEMATHVGLGHSALARALAVLDSDTLRTHRDAAASAARVTVTRAATRVARLSHQLHGAVGVTQEYHLHRLTTALWAWRDADETEAAVSRRLGALARDTDEPGIWQHLTG